MRTVRQVEARAISEPERSFVGFYRSEFTRATRFAYLLCGSRAVADDLVQDSFLAIEPHFHLLRNPAAYLRKTVVRQAANLHRLERRRADRQYLLYDAGYVAPPAREMADLLAALSFQQRAALTLRFWCGFDNAEIAEVLDCRVGTVKSSISRGLAHLRRALEES